MLDLNNIECVYSDVILAVKGLSLHVPEKGCVALLGANGAGKSTVLKGISGVIRSENGRITSGRISFAGERVDKKGAEQIVRLGLVHVMEGRRVLPHMTVEQNLIVGGHLHKTGREMRRTLDFVYENIPRLTDLRRRSSGYLSGGEQQMMVIGRALMAQPKLMLIDEPSLGLAPMMVDDVFEVLAKLLGEGLTLLIVEQNTRMALDLADHAYVMENGRIVLKGSSEELKANEDVREFYLGLDLEGERKAYSEVKHYRRRKRWLG